MSRTAFPGTRHRFGPATRAGTLLLATLASLALIAGPAMSRISPGSRLAKILVGAGPELASVALVMLLSFVIGVGAGAASTLGLRVLDTLLSRAAEITGALPSVIVVFVVRALYPMGSLLSLAATLAVLRGLSSGKGIRAETLQLLREDFVLSARALGTSDTRLFRKHVFPHVAPTALGDASVSASALVALDAAAAFLGLGGGTDSWGAAIAQAARGGGLAGALFPALGIAATITSFWLIQSGLETGRPRVPRYFG